MRVDNPRAAVNLAAAADGGAPFDRDAGMDDGVRADHHVAIDIGGSGIFNGHAGVHQLNILFLSHDPADLRQLAAAVDAADFVSARQHERLHAPSLVPEDLDQVGQVVLPLSVLRGDAADGVEQTGQGEGVDARIDFTDGPFGRRRVLLFNAADDVSVRADDPAVAEGVVDMGGDDGGRGAARFVPFAQLLEGGRREQRDVAVQQQQRAGRAADDRLGGQQRVGRAELRLLDHQRHFPVVPQRPTDRVGFMADHDGRGAWPERARRRKDVLNHRTAGNVVKDFRAGRLHARALARGKNDDVKVRHALDYRAVRVLKGRRRSTGRTDEDGTSRAALNASSSRSGSRSGSVRARARFSGFSAIARSRWARASAGSWRCACATASM